MRTAYIGQHNAKHQFPMIKVGLSNSIKKTGRTSQRDKKKAEQDRQHLQSAIGEAFGCVLLSFPENRLFHSTDFKAF